MNWWNSWNSDYAVILIYITVQYYIAEDKSVFSKYSFQTSFCHICFTMFHGKGVALFLTYILNKLVILILMAQYRNAPSESGILALGEIGIGYQNT